MMRTQNRSPLWIALNSLGRQRTRVSYLPRRILERNTDQNSSLACSLRAYIQKLSVLSLFSRDRMRSFSCPLHDFSSGWYRKFEQSAVFPEAGGVSSIFQTPAFWRLSNEDEELTKKRKQMENIPPPKKEKEKPL